MAFSLSDYEILDTLGTGGFGTVYRARQKSLGRIVALKCLSPQRAQNKSEILRFQREAQAMASLSHENIISVFDYAYASGTYYIVMEYVEGACFAQALRDRIPINLSLYVMQKVLSAISCAHEKQIIHRDIKPANIFLGNNGQVKLADFGLALIQQEMTSQTMNAAIGTLSYMAPEVMVSPGDIDHKADIFSFGCVLYEALSGSVAFSGSTMAEISYKILNENPTPLHPDKHLSALASLTEKCISKDRENRPSIDEIQQAFRDTITGISDASPERLAAFVRKQDSKSGNVCITNPTTIALKKKNKTKSLILNVSIGAVAFALIVVAFIMYYNRSDKNQMSSPASSLTYQILEQAVKPEITLPKKKPNVGMITQDGPAPITGSDEETRSGSLFIVGLLSTDTLIINGEIINRVDTVKNLRHSISPGHYRAEIHDTSRKVYTKEFEIMPYQTVEWRIAKR